MLDTNHYKNSSCTFAGQIVAYLYDEATAQEKTDFEAHLTNCENCAEELSAFGFVRSSVQQWRTGEFLPMQTPAIEIPFEKSLTAANPSENYSWLNGLRQFFTLSPLRTAALAVLVVCVGLTLFVYNFSGKTEIAQKNDNKLTESASPKIEQTKKTDSEELAAKDKKDNPDDAIEVENTSAKIENTFPAAPKSSPEKNSNTVKRRTKTETFAQNNRKSSEPNRKLKNAENIDNSIMAKNMEAPKLANFEEVEDNSLRLSDLISEVGDK